MGGDSPDSWRALGKRRYAAAPQNSKYCWLRAPATNTIWSKRSSVSDGLLFSCADCSIPARFPFRMMRRWSPSGSSETSSMSPLMASRARPGSGRHPPVRDTDQQLRRSTSPQQAKARGRGDGSGDARRAGRSRRSTTAAHQDVRRTCRGVGHHSTQTKKSVPSQRSTSGQ
jgi:hypothetical protein